jgi:hypothetical protein
MIDLTWEQGGFFPHQLNYFYFSSINNFIVAYKCFALEFTWPILFIHDTVGLVNIITFVGNK